jgi:azurin
MWIKAPFLALYQSAVMKNKFSFALPIVSIGCGVLLFSVASCSRAPEAPPKTVAVNANDKMKYDLTAFEVTPGQKVIVNFKNVGTTPKFSMGHNFVLLDHSVNTGNVQAFLDKASTEASHDYVPPDAKEVLAHSKLLGPNETETVTFNAPFVPGDYLYLCSFPGHYAQGTKGIMTVKR